MSVEVLPVDRQVNIMPDTQDNMEQVNTWPSKYVRVRLVIIYIG